MQTEATLYSSRILIPGPKINPITVIAIDPTTPVQKKRCLNYHTDRRSELVIRIMQRE